jgi:hypothetical protein
MYGQQVLARQSTSEQILWKVWRVPECANNILVSLFMTSCTLFYGYRFGGTPCLHLQSVSKRCHNPEYHTLCLCMFLSKLSCKEYLAASIPTQYIYLHVTMLASRFCTRHWSSCLLTANINIFHTEIHRWKLIMLHSRISIMKNYFSLYFVKYSPSWLYFKYSHSIFTLYGMYCFWYN